MRIQKKVFKSVYGSSEFSNKCKLLLLNLDSIKTPNSFRDEEGLWSYLCLVSCIFFFMSASLRSIMAASWALLSNACIRGRTPF